MAASLRILAGLMLLAGFQSSLLGGAPAAAADSRWLARTWQTDEGLPDNNVTGIVQSPDGFLWVATLGGLVRFDGADFEQFSATHLPKFPSFNVRKIFLDGRGQLWMAMDRGVVIRVGATSAQVFDQGDGLPGTRVTSIAEYPAGVLWIVAGSEVCRIQGEKAERIGAAAGLPAGGSSWLAADGRGEVWFARGAQVGVIRDGRFNTLLTLDSYPVRFVAARTGGLWICNGTQLLKYTEGSEPQPVARLPKRIAVRTLLEDRHGALWIGTGAEGLFRWHGGELEQVSVSHPEITSLAEDREGNFWVGTGGGGLNLLHPRVMDVINAKSGLPFESARSVCEDADGWIWAAMQNGSLIRGRDSNWKAVASAEGWPGGDAQCVAPAKDGGVWIGTHDRGLQRLRAKDLREWGTSEGLSSPTVRSVLAASNGDVWAATDSPSRLHRLTDGQLQGFALPAGTRSIRALAEGVDGTIWAGTSDGHILRVQGNSVVNELGAQNEKAPFSVRCLHAARDGSLWIGYAGWGVGRWQGGKYARVSAAQGLHDDFVSQILEDGLGGLWLTGNRGLFRVQVEELVAVAEGRSEHIRSSAFGRNDGLPSLQPHHENSPSTWRGTTGQLWFATRNGLLSIQADRITENPVAPPVLLEDIKVDDRLVAQLDSAFPLRATGSPLLLDLRKTNQVLELPPGHAKIELAYTALSFKSPENVHFRHRLSGFDTKWVEAGTQRSVRYPRLSAGRYEFEVTACNEAGIWNDEGFRFPIVVRPFFWETWWFRLGVVAIFTAGVIALVRYVSFRRLRQKMLALEQQGVLDKERSRIAKDLHDDLGASMTQMTLLLELALQHQSEPEAVLGRVQDGLRASREAIKSLDAAVWAVNPANNTLPELVAYIGQFGMEFLQQAGIRCELDLPDHPPERPVSSELRHNLFLIAKEALNNIVRHAQARVVRLSISVTPATLELGIADDGAGIDHVPHDALADGLRNMRQRAEEMNARFSLESEPGKGTRITVSYPWAADN